MRSFSTVIASIALILSAWQAYLSWNARDDHLEVIATERLLNACAEIGLAAADYAALMEPNLLSIKGSGRLSNENWEPLRAGRRSLQRAYFTGTYILGPEYADDLDMLRSNGLEFLDAAFDSDPDGVQAKFDAFADAGQSIQARCRAESTNS
ncbi:MAG: hypothetical protein AAF719_06555 [Pseudomonadota bacterium]